MNKKKLSSWQFSFLVVYPILSLYSEISSFNIIHLVGIDSYLAILLSYFLGLIVSMLFFFIFKYRPWENILEKNIYLFGKYIGTFINVVINIIFMIIGLFLFYSISSFVILYFLNRTPIILFMIFLGIVVMFNVSKGIVNIARVLVFFILLILFLSVISVFGLMYHFDINNLLPVFDNGITPIAFGSYQMFFINIVPIFLLLIIKKDFITPNEKLKKRIFFLYTVSFIIIFLDNVLTIGTLGIYLSQIEKYPLYMVLQKISLFHFLDRIENIIYIKYFLASFGYLSLIIYHISQMFPKTNIKVSSCFFIGTMIILSLFIFQNDTYLFYLSYNYLYIICMILFFTYVVIGITIIFRKRHYKKEY